jgi:LmbE family N-acetylglucosaminyl deacetylase
MKAICMVAHPDDCIIFGLGFILAYPEYDWHICYLTYRHNTPRGREIYNFWSRRSVTVDFLGFSDNKKDIILDKLSFDPVMARNFIMNEIAQYDLVLTHNSDGEYGHVHHRFVHDCCNHHPKLVTFATEGEEYSVPAQYYTLEELPNHARVIRQFVNPENHINYYDTSKL